MSILLSTKRRITQGVTFVMLTFNFWAVSAAQGFCLPIMHCEACAFAWLGCPVGMVARSLAFGEIPFVVIGIFIGIGAILGRFFCGWVCPMGFLQDILHKIPGRKVKFPRFLRFGKYAVLIVSVIVIPYMVGSGLDNVPESFVASGEEAGFKPVQGFHDQDDSASVGGFQFVGEDSFDAKPVEPPEPAYVSSPYFFCNYCPTAALEVVLPTMIVDHDFRLDSKRILRFSVLLVVLFGVVLNHRSFCKVLCPVGALIAITNRFSFLSLRIKADSCIKCRKCDKACPMDVAVMDSQHGKKAVNRDLECIGCLSCEQACPESVISNNSRILRK